MSMDLYRGVDTPCAFCQKVLPGQDLNYVWVPGITNEELADKFIMRLNILCKDKDIRGDIHDLIETRIPCSSAAVAHPTIQTIEQGTPDEEIYLLGFLGLLNGLVGVDPDGHAYLAGSYSYDEGNELTGFQRYTAG